MSEATSSRDVFGDEQFAVAFSTRGAAAESPGALALVTVLQYVENLTDRRAGSMVGSMVARAIDWKYALGLELTDPGFGFPVPPDGGVMQPGVVRGHLRRIVVKDAAHDLLRDVPDRLKLVESNVPTGRMA